MNRDSIKYLLIASISIYLGIAGIRAAYRHADYIENGQVVVRDSLTFYFRQSKWNPDMSFRNNGDSLDSFLKRIAKIGEDTLMRLNHIYLSGSASPEGPDKFNKFLSEQRGISLLRILAPYLDSREADTVTVSRYPDWSEIFSGIRSDEKIPYKKEVLKVCDSVYKSGSKRIPYFLKQLKDLHQGEPYRYILSHIFPKSRTSKVIVEYESSADLSVNGKNNQDDCRRDTIYIEREVARHDTVYIFRDVPCQPLYVDIRTNMLLDAAALPNLGIEIYAGMGYSVGGTWIYGWWSNDRRHRYWRGYGGELFARRWFGESSRKKPLTGHHLGIYGQVFTYDFEWGGKGEMGGVPGGDLCDKAQWGVGIEYGYSLPIKSRINIDLSLGLGYVTGKYHKYHPDHGHYVWESTHRRHYFGPSKLAVSLVWLIGRGNVNRKKGGDI